MSVLVDKLRAVLLSNLRPDMPKAIRDASWNLFNSIDQDMDVAGYTSDTVSSTTEEALEKFDHALKRNELLDLEIEEEEVPAIEVEVDSPKKLPSISDEDLTEET